MQNMKDIMIASFMWKFFERASTQIINLAVQIVLARLIAPEDFGSLAILVVFINISNIFVQKGFSSSLIRKKEASEEDYNTVLTISLATSFVLYVILFLLAPRLDIIYKVGGLCSALRVIALQLFFGSVYCVQNAILVRQMQFKTIFIRGFISSVISGTVGIILAAYGFGLWALVIQSLLNQLLLCTTAWFGIRWRPRLDFCKQNFLDIFSFGGNILVSELLSYGAESLRTLLIGGVYSKTALSYYDRGQTYPATLMRGIYDTLGGVMLPYFSRKQNDKEEMIRDFYFSISVSMFIITPVFVGMAAVSSSLIYLLLTEKWTEAIPYFMLFCIYQIPYPLQGLSRQLLYACGESRYVLRQEIIKAAVATASLLAALPLGVMAVAWSALVTMYMMTWVNMIYVRKVIPIRFSAIGKCLYKTMLACVVMFFIVWMQNRLVLPHGLLLLIQIFTGALTYIILAILLKNQNYTDLLKIIKKN